MTRVERRLRIIFDTQLYRLGDPGVGEFANDRQREIDPRGDAAGGNDVPVPDHAPLFMRGTDQRQQVGVGPVCCRAAALEHTGGAEDEGAGADRGHVACTRGRLPDERDRFRIRHGLQDAGAAGHANQMERRTGLEGRGRHEPEPTIARHRIERFRDDMRLRAGQTAEHLQRPGEVELGQIRKDHEPDIEVRQVGSTLG
jgi:hypothetical protein